MKKIITGAVLFILLIIVIIAASYALGSKSLVKDNVIDNSLNNKNNETVGPEEVKSENITYYDGKKYAIASFKVADMSSLKLLGNFDQRRTAEKIVDDSKCDYAISGGFYTRDYKPIGLYIEDNKIISNFEVNNLLNGTLWIDNNQKAGIGNGVDRVNLKYAIQSGPQIMENGQPTALNIINDNYKRRNAVGINAKGELIFMSVYNPESIFEGPRLSDMPDIVYIFSRNNNNDIKTALNLDGGSASYFKNQNITLSELSSAGSIICISRLNQ